MIALGEKIGQAAFPDMLIAMSGDLGAGKTTLVKGIGAGLGIRDGSRASAPAWESGTSSTVRRSPY